MILSQILRFSLPRSSAISAPAFLKLRDFVKSHGQVEDQYFGYIVTLLKQKKSDEMCWIIRWSSQATFKAVARLIPAEFRVAQYF